MTPPAYDFHGRVALVTGSSRGIGRATALALAAAGADVVVHYRRDEAAARSACAEVERRGRRAHLARADLEFADQVAAMVDEAGRVFGRLDFLVANAAATAFKPLLDLEAHHLTRTLDVVVRAFLVLAQRAVSLMPPGSSIVTVSGFDTVRVLAGHGLLAAAKSALETLTRYLAVELAPRAISVNGVMPGFVDTDSARIWAERSGGPDPAAAARATPRGRMATPEELARVILFLCSADARVLVGQTIVADGGVTLV